MKRYCLYINTVINDTPILCEILSSKFVDGREIIEFVPVIQKSSFNWGQRFADEDSITILTKETNPEYFL